MMWTLANAAMCVAATVAPVIVAFADGQTATTLPEGDGRPIVEKSCTGCHGLDVITPLELEKDVWREIVFEMKSRGAEVSDEQIPIVIEYLAKNFGSKKGAAAGRHGIITSYR